MSDKIKRAELLARFVHFGQKRQDGEDYINHPERIVTELNAGFCTVDGVLTNEKLPLTPKQEDMICAAWLHDTTEDQHILERDTFQDIIYDIFGRHVSDLVYILSHQTLETYNEYMTRVIQDPEALQIKWLDLKDNNSYNIPEKQKIKYRNACLYLQSIGIIVPIDLRENLKI